MFNGVLALPVPEKATIISFTDDLAKVVIAKHSGELYAIKTEKAGKSWLDRVGRTLSDEKTQVVLVTKGRQNNALKLKVGRHTVASKPTKKIRGMMINAKLNLREV